MYIELEDVKNANIVKIEGDTVMGRAGGDNDFPVNDPSVSGRHARIFQDGGRWFLEDLGSSNGTFVKGSKITSPVELVVGVKFSLCRHVFNVVEVEGESSEQPTAIFDGGDTAADGSWGAAAAAAEEPAPMEPVKTKQARTRDRPKAPAYDRAPGKPTKAPSGEASSTEAVNRSRKPAAEGDKATPPSTDESLVPYLLKTVPQAIGYYLAAIPLMLFNPVGTVRKGIQEMRFDAFGWKELMAWAIPPLAIQQFLGAIGAILISIVVTGFSAGAVIMPLIMVFVVPPIAGLITGFIAHPILRWFVHKLFGGQTDPTTRTNYILMSFVFMPISGFATLVGTLLGLVPLPFVGIVPILISMAAGLVSLYITYAWFQFFQVKKWVMYLLLALVVLSVIGNAFGMVGVVTAGVAQLSGGSSGGVGTAAAALSAATAGDAGAAIEAQIEAMKEAGTLTPEVEKAMRAQIEAARQGMAAAAAAAQGAEGAEEAAAAAAKVVEAAAKGAEAAAKSADAGAKSADAGAKSAAAEATPAKAGPKVSYAVYQQRLSAVEAALEENPTLMRRPGVKKLYTELKAREFKISSQYKPKAKKGTPEAQAEAAVKEKLRDAEIYEETVDIVSKLYGMVVK